MAGTVIVLSPPGGRTEAEVALHSTLSSCVSRSKQNTLRRLGTQDIMIHLLSVDFHNDVITPFCLLHQLRSCRQRCCRLHDIKRVVSTHEPHFISTVRQVK